ncbi:unnamed protein product [Mucor hiemalis]
MEKFREKINSIRAEADAANTRAAEYENKYKESEQSNINLEHQVSSLKTQNQHLEEKLETAEQRIEELKAIEQNEDNWHKDKEASQRKITLLEQELEKSELTVRETTKNFREADVKAEHFERKVQQLEIISNDLEKKNEDLKTRIRN